MRNNNTGPINNRSKSCPLSGKDAPRIDYKNIRLLNKFISEKGKIMPSRITSVSFRKQKKLSQAIKRARYLALLSYSEKKYINN
ncbi:MAG: 30S ribosomal protein S18 [Alphaproteobacteria bacterium MarineAlpha5_Bin12]|nr:30S ribosomal protein S18 [Pelagibacteraceae bacterium]PPR41764.1 MAG: 30S ribosomal protein S18 [Alphaproteobacteria bacterium MarineAlpha5_Bin12]|tara:strand:- start:25329 stop:25580 length:252 start_codon:yes stop_codon:yes gene_type:complete